jgi:FtsX-like permease family/MacB-like periplasmic core domain
VLSNFFWRSRFSADPHIVGRTVDLNKHPFTIIGVAPKSFHGTELIIWPDFWIPIVNQEQIDGFNFLTKRYDHATNVLGALKPGVTAQQATDDLNSIAHHLAQENPSSDDTLSARLVKPGLMGDMLAGPARPFLSGIMVLALLVLLAACVNLASIFAARTADRARELAIRLSIGATRWRILRQLVTEAVLVSMAAGVVGTIAAAALLQSLSRWQPFAEFPIHVTVVADTRVYLIALLLSLASAVLPGLIPARQVWRAHAMQAVRSGAPITGLSHNRLIPQAYLARSAAGSADYPVRPSGDRLIGIVARHGALAARAPRFCAPGCSAGRGRFAYGWLLRRLCSARATAHDRGGRAHPWSDRSRNHQRYSARHRRQLDAGVPRGYIRPAQFQ